MESIQKLRMLVGAVLLFLTTALHAEPIIDSGQAAFFVGTEAMVCGTVTEVKTFSKGTYLNMGPPYPRQHISILIWNSNEQEFNDRFGGLSLFGGRKACARGLIESYRNKLQIKVSNAQFLRLMK